MAVANFPAIVPTARSWTPGQRPMQAVTSMAGYEVRVLTGSASVGQRLSLQYNNLLEAVCDQITSHYALAQGTFELFDLPAAVFGGMAGYGHIKPANSKWRYGSPPSVTYVAPGIQSVSVDLIAVPQ